MEEELMKELFVPPSFVAKTSAKVILAIFPL